MIHTTLDNFFLDDEALENSPSRRSGIDRDTETGLRHYGCELIQEAGVLLGFQQVVMATGQVLFHRFYCKRSMKEYNVKKLAATALWQGAKLEEAPEVSGHPRELLNKIMVAVDRCIARRETPEGRKLAVLDLHSKESEEFRRSLIRYEVEMLKAFGFITHVEHPHKLMLNYLQILGLALGVDTNEPEFPGFVQEAWNVANDSLRTTLCVRFKSSIIACGIIFFVSRKLKVALPESPPWYEIFEVKLSHIYEVCAALHQLYNAPKAQFIPVFHQILPSKPPTPATAGATSGSVVAGATPTPGPGRPAKPLDPSIRLPADSSFLGTTPGQQANGSAPVAAAAASGSTPAAGQVSNPPSAAPSPQQSLPPGSAQKRKDRPGSRSPAVSDDSRKRRRDDDLQPQQQVQGAPAEVKQADEVQQQASGRSSRHVRSRSRSRSRDRDRDRSRAGKQSSRRSRSRSGSRSRDPGHHRDSSRGESRYDRDRRYRDRDRGHHHSRGRDYGSDRDRDRERRRNGSERRDIARREGRDSGDGRGSNKSSEQDRKELGSREEDRGKDKQRPGAGAYPPPPKQTTTPDDSKQQQQRTSSQGGADNAAAGVSKPTSPTAAVPPKPKPVAVRKKSAQQVAGAVEQSAKDGAGAPSLGVAGSSPEAT